MFIKFSKQEIRIKSRIILRAHYHALIDNTFCLTVGSRVTMIRKHNGSVLQPQDFLPSFQ